MALEHENFTTALYLAQAASDDYECLREGYDVPIIFSGSTSRAEDWEYLGFSIAIRKSALSALILGLRLGEGEGLSPLELDSVPGVDWNELFDRNGFSELHKIVFRFSSQPLDAAIEARPEDLNRPDCIGLTALWYACRLGNSNHIRILLQHGADVNNTLVPPICAAVWRGSYDSVEQILNAGASITDQSIRLLYLTLMHLPSGLDVHEVLIIDKALFGRFLNINYRPSINGNAPPLVILARQRLPRSHARIRQLLELGADTELADERGLTALCHAISAGNTESCKILGRAGANPNVQTDTAQTILHLAIIFATDTDIIQAVSELDLSGVELGASDDSGYTAFELFEIRAGRHRNDQHFFPGLYCYDKERHSLYPCYDRFSRDHYVKNIDTELNILSSFQTLLQQVQEAQGIPVEDRYPLLNLTRESLMIDQNEDDSFTTLPSVPGAWPEN